jgi:hypothetical protein
MPSHQPDAQRLRSVDESRHPVRQHRPDSPSLYPADPSPRPADESRFPADQSHFDSERNWLDSPRLRLVDQEHHPADQRQYPVEPQEPPRGVPTTADNADRRAPGRRLVGPPERRRWGRAAPPPENEPGTGKIARRLDGPRQDDH